MTVKRVTSGLEKLDLLGRYIILYGKVNDKFCTPNLLIQDIEQILRQYLADLGLERILFYSAANKLYFLDDKSRDLCLPKRQIKAKSSQEMVTRGPLGNKRKSVVATPTNPTSAPTTQTQPIQDIQCLPYFDMAMTEAQPRSAIIFAHATDLERARYGNLEIFYRNLFGRMESDWNRLDIAKRNLCIFIFPFETLEQVKEFCQTRQINALVNVLENQPQSCVHISGPDTGELQNLLHYFRLKDRQSLDWVNLQSLVEQMVSENKSLEDWYKRWNFVKNISLAEAKQQKWITTLPMPSKEELTSFLQSKIIGQKPAIETIVRRVRGKLRTESTKPLVFILPGPTGTGKTEISKTLAESLGVELIRFDMGEFAEEYKASNLFGSATGFVGSEQGGRLPNELRKNPKLCVILFDEVEKAHDSLWQKMLGFFDEGRITDTLGIAIAPKNTICLLTTNLKAEEVASQPEKAKDILRETRVFSREFLGRVDRVIPMGRLSNAEILELTDRLVKSLAQGFGITELIIDTNIADELLNLVAEDAEKEGGRGIYNKMKDLLEEDFTDLQENGVTRVRLILEGTKIRAVKV